jgi:serine O-acetyltransferase
MHSAIRAAKERDPAARNSLEILLTYSGVHAIGWHRLAHSLWQMGLKTLGRMVSQLSRFLTGIEIHPGAQVGQGLFIDHGSGIVVGETTIIGDNVSLFQGVTLGGTGKETGKRHPTIMDNVTIGAGAKVLGNITIGSGSYIGANAVVLRDVPPNCTVVGVPGRVVREEGKRVSHASTFDHVHLPDPVIERIRELERLMMERITHLEEAAAEYERFKKDWETIRAEHMAIHHANQAAAAGGRAADGQPPCRECGKDHPPGEHTGNE